MPLLSEPTRRALARVDGRPRRILALVCAGLAALLALTGGGSPAADPAPAAVDAAPTAAGAGFVAAAVPAGAAGLVAAAGDRVDVYAARLDLGPAPPALLASDVRVLDVVAPARAGEPGGYLVIELSNGQARDLAAAADAALTVVVRGRDP